MLTGAVFMEVYFHSFPSQGAISVLYTLLCIPFVFYCVSLFLFFLVGFDGQNNLVSCGADLDQAKKVFGKKYVQTDKLF